MQAVHGLDFLDNLRTQLQLCAAQVGLQLLHRGRADEDAGHEALLPGKGQCHLGEVQFVPSMNVELDRDSAGKVFRLVEALEDLDDVQNVFGNFDVSDEVLEALDA